MALLERLNEAQQSRRTWLKVGAAVGGGLWIGFGPARAEDRKKPPSERAVGHAATQATGEAPSGFAHSAFIRIDRQGQVTLVMHKVEMGQGTYTAMPMLLAEELEVDPTTVKLEHAPPDNKQYGDPLLGGQVTGGSTSVRSAWKPLRQAGATARMLLVAEAASRWNVDPSSCQAHHGIVMHPASGRSLGYGALVDAAARRTPPKDVPLKPAKDFQLIGKPLHRLDSVEKTNGQARFGIDVQRPGLRIATVAASPVVGGRLKAADNGKAMAVRGVRQVLKLDGAVAVVGDHFWAAKQGLAALEPQWDDGAHARFSTTMLIDEMRSASQQPGAVARRDGDAVAVLAQAGEGRVLEAVYELPFLAHATLEPPNCTVELTKDGCDLWVGTQVPTIAQGAVAKLTGLPLERVRVHNHLIGGGFGRRLEVDFIVQAVEFAKQVRGPVKFIWTREEDIQHDMLRPYYFDRLRASLDSEGRPAAWSHRVTGSSIMARFAPPAVKDGVDPDAVEGARDLPYAIPNVQVEYVRHEPPVPTAFWRGVGPTHNIFVVESFIDELAAAAKADPVAYRRALLDKAPRVRQVLEVAAREAGWGQPLPSVEGQKLGRGVSVQFAFGSYMAQVAEVAVAADGSVKVRRVVCAVDCGQVVNPDIVKAQIESGVNFGITAALWGEITHADGRVQQHNFNDYRMLRIDEAPRIDVHLITSPEDPGGIGEPGTSALAPAVANAVHAATGRRIRKLPIGQQGAWQA